MDDTIIVFTTMPDREAALGLARTLVERRLAACVNVMAACTSIYRWQDEVQETAEVPLMIKTRGVLYDELQAAVAELHPYDVPEIIAVELARGMKEYLQWVADSTSIAIG